MSVITFSIEEGAKVSMRDELGACFTAAVWIIAT
jgi:hypothetical protein